MRHRDRAAGARLQSVTRRFDSARCLSRDNGRKEEHVKIKTFGTVDDRSLAVLNGSRPDRSNRVAWALGCSLAALGGVLYKRGKR